MSETHSVLILDDGELDDLAVLLGELRVNYTRLRGGQIEEGMQPPLHLLVTTPRRAGATLPGSPPGAASGRPLRIVSTEEDSNSMRGLLRDQGVHYLVRRPTHREVWRLLAQRALYQGDERRRDERVAVGSPISVEQGDDSDRVLLVDVSNRGCRLISEAPLEIGSELAIEIPADVTGEDPLPLRGQILRASQRGERGYSAAMIFDADLPDPHRMRLTDLLNRWTRGDGVLDRSDPSLVPLPASESAAIPGLTLDEETDPAVVANVAVDVQLRDSERRQHTRGTFPHPVTAETVAATRPAAWRDGRGMVLMGRDLSPGGMRVESLPDLSIGDRFQLGLFGPGLPEALRVHCEVIRDDGEEGLALAFRELAPETAGKLEKLVACLPDIESLQDGEAAGLGSVISEVLTDSE